MNVYSLRLIPQLKLKLCEFLGVASTMAMEQLMDRLDRLDQKMDRFDTQLRRIQRQQMVMQATQLQVSEKKKRPSPARKSKRRVKKAAAPVTPTKTAVKKTKSARKLERVSPAKVTPIPVKKVVVDSPPTLPAAEVLMVQCDEEAQARVQSYFGEKIKVRSVDQMAQLAESLGESKPLAIFFQRNLLSDAETRKIFTELREQLPETRFVGISSYLTLALSQAMEETWATFLTQPLTEASLAEVFADSELKSEIRISKS